MKFMFHQRDSACVPWVYLGSGSSAAAPGRQIWQSIVLGTPKVVIFNAGRISMGSQPEGHFGTVSWNLGVENVELSSSAPGRRRRNRFRNRVPAGVDSDPRSGVVFRPCSVNVVRKGSLTEIFFMHQNGYPKIYVLGFPSDPPGQGS